MIKRKIQVNRRINLLETCSVILNVANQIKVKSKGKGKGKSKCTNLINFLTSLKYLVKLVLSLNCCQDSFEFRLGCLLKLESLSNMYF